MAADLDMVARAFMAHNYNTFDSNLGELGNLYQDSSMLSFEGDKTQGVAAIAAKLAALPFQQCAHCVSTIDSQLFGPSDGVIVFVSGSLQLSNEQHMLKFS